MSTLRFGLLTLTLLTCVAPLAQADDLSGWWRVSQRRGSLQLRPIAKDRYAATWVRGAEVRVGEAHTSSGSLRLEFPRAAGLVAALRPPATTPLSPDRYDLARENLFAYRGRDLAIRFARKSKGLGEALERVAGGRPLDTKTDGRFSLGDSLLLPDGTVRPLSEEELRRAKVQAAVLRATQRLVDSEGGSRLESAPFPPSPGELARLPAEQRQDAFTKVDGQIWVQRHHPRHGWTWIAHPSLSPSLAVDRIFARPQDYRVSGRIFADLVFLGALRQLWTRDRFDAHFRKMGGLKISENYDHPALAELLEVSGSSTKEAPEGHAPQLGDQVFVRNWEVKASERALFGGARLFPQPDGSLVGLGFGRTSMEDVNYSLDTRARFSANRYSSLTTQVRRLDPSVADPRR